VLYEPRRPLEIWENTVLTWVPVAVWMMTATVVSTGANSSFQFGVRGCPSVSGWAQFVPTHQPTVLQRIVIYFTRLG
jgi:hypothetical protein